MTLLPNPPSTPADIVIFFGPGIARDTDATCALSIGATVLARCTLRHGAASVEIGIGDVHVALPTAVRSADRPVFVRIGVHEDGTFCQVGARPRVMLPDGNAAFGFDTVAAPAGVSIDRIASASDAPPLLPRGLAPANAQAGAVDHVSRSGGITGWIVDLERAALPHDIELRCGDVVLARTRADRARPAKAPFVDRAPLGRFSIPWADIDRDQLDHCARVSPAAPVTVAIPALGVRLDDVYRPVSARTALTLAGPVLHLASAGPLPAVEPLCLAAGTRRVSAVIPNYNYAHYLPQRLDSLFAQGAELEIIVLDDASTDASLAVVLATAAAAGREIQIVTSPRNSGSVLTQWRRATSLSRGDYLLIAEADDVAEPALVESLAAMLDTHPDMIFAFGDSMQIDAAGAIIRSDFKSYYAALGDRALDRTQVVAADAFLLRFLLPRNLVVNVSAVLWRTAALRAAFARLGPEIANFRATGDWRVYIEACRAGGSVGYVPTPLNRFRRHEDSVVARQGRDRHLAEIDMIHALLLSLYGGDATLAERLGDHRATLRRLWSLPPVMDEAGDTA